MTKQEIKAVLKHTLPVLAGYIFLGIAFGLLMSTKGFSIWKSVIMSLTIYSGALEFAAVGLLAQPFNPVSSFLLGFILSMRHLFYGLPMLNRYKKSGKAKPFLIFGLTDETFSILSCTEPPEGVRSKQFYIGVTLVNYIYWNTGTLIGALLGQGGLNAEGLDFALTALFIVLLVEQLKTRSGFLSGMTGLIVTGGVLMLLGAEKMIPVSMLIITALLIMGKKVLQDE